MADLVATPEAIRQYGKTSAALASETLAVASIDQLAVVAAAVPVFGLIGQDFLASYAMAQASHLTAVAEVAAVHAGTAVAAFESAAYYTATDLDSADNLGSIGNV
ncbi:type VII secretion target [Nocardia higoensis]|uniref:type VII secretion target n=1 Tax=Nocardia higoensis TaxID=228599 RepID=UPI0002F0B2B5|nr:type VII secretion target [Nocardia higoensis]